MAEEYKKQKLSYYFISLIKIRGDKYYKYVDFNNQKTYNVHMPILSSLIYLRLLNYFC